MNNSETARSTISRGRLVDWPHSPVHQLLSAGAYLVTAATYGKAHLFHSVERLNYLTNALLVLAEEYEWRLQAWAIFSNHYHFIGESAEASTLPRLVQYLHSVSAKHLNLTDATPGRTVWFQYWDTRITHEKSYLARLHYVHQNPVRHGLVRVATDYPWCSASWFETKAPRPFYRTVCGFKTDKVNVPDNFDVMRITESGVREPSSRFNSS